MCFSARCFMSLLVGFVSDVRVKCAGTLTTTRKARIAGLVSGLMAAQQPGGAGAAGLPSSAMLHQRAAQELRKAAAGDDDVAFSDRFARLCLLAFER